MILRFAFILLLGAIAIQAQVSVTPTSVRFRFDGRTVEGVGRTREVSIVVPADDTISVEGAGSSGVRLIPSGSYDGRRLVTVRIDSIRAMDLTVRWNRTLVPARAIAPPSAPFVLNAAWMDQQTSKRRSKATDGPQGGVDPKTWYDPSRPYVRVETTHDGVAAILGSDLLAIAPSMAGRTSDRLRLLQRGVDRYLLLRDADGSGGLSDPDTIIFVGSRAAGDTTYWDLQDTSAVFFLTTRDEPSDMVYGAWSVSDVSTTPVASIDITRRFELDSGYYHPGSSNENSEDYSTFLTPMATFEGFYWESLNARAAQLATQDVVFTPASDGTVTVMAEVLSSTNVKAYAPDHFIHVSANGSAPTLRSGDGIARYVVPIAVPAVEMPSGLQSVRVFSQGPDSLRATPDWFGEVLLNAIIIRGPSATVLDGGRLIGRIRPVPSAELRLLNASSAAGYVIDTIAKEVRSLTIGERGVTVRAGLAPSFATNPYSQESVGTYDVSAMVDDVSIRVRDTRSYVVVRRAGTGGVVSRFVTLNADEIVDSITSAPSETLFTIINAGNTPTTALRDVLRANGVDVGTTDTLFIASVFGGTGARAVASASRSCGLTWFAPFTGAPNGVARADRLRGGEERFCVIGVGTGVERARVKPARLLDLASDRTPCDVIVVTAGALRPSAERWASYRSSASNKRIRVVDVEAIFDEFDAGRHSPEAIRLYLARAFENAETKPTHAIMFGNASWDVRLAVKGGNARSSRPDLVPTYGKPSSDYWFGLLDDPNDLKTPELIVARFPVLTAAEADAMIDKIITSDTTMYAPWQRRFLYVGGGETTDEGLCDIYEAMLTDRFGTGVLYQEPTLCIDTVTICKAESADPGFEIRSNLNAGVAVMNYIGHGGTEVFDIRGWDPEDLRNVGRYPIMATYSCLTGAFSNSSALCRNAQYLVQPNAGFVAAIGATGWQYQLVVSQIHTDFHEALRTTSIRDLGRLTYAAKYGMATFDIQFAMNATMQFNILGDPFTTVHIDTSEQLSVSRDRVIPVSTAGGAQIREDDDSAHVDVTVWSEGTGTRVPYVVRLRRTYAGVTDSSTFIVSDGACREDVVRFTLDVAGKVGQHIIEVHVDPDGVVDDRPDDDRASVVMTVYAKSPLVLEPDPYGVMSREKIHARIIDILSTSDVPYRFDAVLTRRPDTTAPLVRSNAGEFTRTGSIVDWSAQRPDGLNSTADLWIGVWGTDTRTGAGTTIVWTPVRVRESAVEAGEHIVAASAWTYSNETLKYDSTANALALSTYARSVLARSSGVMTADPDREPLLVVRIGTEEILRSSFRTGLNIVVIGQRDTVPAAIRRYDTSKDPAPITTGHYGFARECLTFLRDSVRSTDRIVIAACNESFARFIADTLLDSLRVQLRRFGSRFADSVGLGSSYALISTPGTPIGLASEAWKASPDYMVTTTSPLDFHYAEGTAESPQIGPARRWNTVRVEGAGTLHTQLLGMRADGTTEVVDTTGVWTPADGAPHIIAVRCELVIAGTEEVPDASLTAISASYEPLPQWVMERNGLTFVADTVLRGDDATLQAAIRNARSMWASPPTTLRISSGGMAPVEATIASIGPDAVEITSASLTTASLPSSINVAAQIDPDRGTPQLYNVLDRAEATLWVREDAEPPGIDVFVDDRLMLASGTVYREPLFEIRLRDNASLPITDPLRLMVFVNGTRIRSDNVDDWAFLPTSEAQTLWPGTDVRAALRFRFPLESGENLLIVRATDASNNADTVELSLYTTDIVTLGPVTVAPNPTLGPTSFLVDLASPDVSSPVHVRIMDMQGRVVRTLDGTLAVGKATLPWDGRGNAGEVLASGVYGWTLHVENLAGTSGAEASGTLMIVR